jgi:N-acetylmuramoyl-L-alanine amidase
MQEALIRVTNLRNRGAKQRMDLAVLRFSGPAVLIELGFIGNDGDRETLLNPAMREKVCTAVADIVAPATT